MKKWESREIYLRRSTQEDEWLRHVAHGRGQKCLKSLVQVAKIK